MSEELMESKICLIHLVGFFGGVLMIVLSLTQTLEHRRIVTEWECPLQSQPLTEMYCLLANGTVINASEVRNANDTAAVLFLACGVILVLGIILSFLSWFLSMD
jgi:hypothetical protein